MQPKPAIQTLEGIIMIVIVGFVLAVYGYVTTHGGFTAETFDQFYKICTLLVGGNSLFAGLRMVLKWKTANGAAKANPGTAALSADGK